MFDSSQINAFPVENYPTDENMWEYLCQLDPYIIGADGIKGGGTKDLDKVTKLK